MNLWEVWPAVIDLFNRVFALEQRPAPVIPPAPLYYIIEFVGPAVPGGVSVARVVAGDVIESVYANNGAAVVDVTADVTSPIAVSGTVAVTSTGGANGYIWTAQMRRG